MSVGADRPLQRQARRPGREQTSPKSRHGAVWLRQITRRAQGLRFATTLRQLASLTRCAFPTSCTRSHSGVS